jgi:hypothetical protein
MGPQLVQWTGESWKFVVSGNKQKHQTIKTTTNAHHIDLNERSSFHEITGMNPLCANIS